MPEIGLEPIHSCERGILSPLCLPFHHSGIKEVRIWFSITLQSIKPNSSVHGSYPSKIEYTGPYSRVGFEKQFNYIIESASCWNNKIKRLTINIHNDNNVLIDRNKWEIGSYSSFNFPEQAKVSKNCFSFIFENIDPGKFKEINLRIKPYDLNSNWLPFNDDANGWGYNIYKVFQDENEIWLYTEKQIQLFINCFYASKGYIFKKKELEQYFKNKHFDLLNTDYVPDKNFNELKFNKTEKENIDFLLNMKKKLYKIGKTHNTAL